MNRIVLLIAALGTNLSFLLARRAGKGMVRRHGRTVRVAALLLSDGFLSAALFLPVSWTGLACCYLAVSLSTLLQPVPPNKAERMDILCICGLAAVPLSLFSPLGSAILLCAVLLASRIWQARARSERLDALVRTHTYRKYLSLADRSNWEALWSVLLLLPFLSRGIPVLEPVCCVLPLLLYAWLDLRWCTGSPFFAVPVLEESLARAVSCRHPFFDDSQEPDRALYERCCRYMTERRPFLVESFSLLDLTHAMFTNKVYLSKTINRFSGKNFRQYVNYYRVMYSLDLFRDNKSLRVTEMASLSGFHSTTSFNQSFKRVMGESPSHWCSRIRKKELQKYKK